MDEDAHELKNRCYNRRIKSLKKIDMENVKDIAFNDDGSLTITLKDGSAPTNYVPASAAPAAPTQTVALASGETLLVTAA